MAGLASSQALCLWMFRLPGVDTPGSAVRVIDKRAAVRLAGKRATRPHPSRPSLRVLTVVAPHGPPQEQHGIAV